MENLFAYGTLMCQDIMAEVAGCRLDHVVGTLTGYRRLAVKGEHFPALVKDGTASVQGIVYRAVPLAAWERLDRFEGEMYDRKRVPVVLGESRTLDAHAYVVNPAFGHRLESFDWDVDEFLRVGKARFQKHYKGFGLL